MTFFSELSNPLVNDSGSCLFVYFFGSPAALILVVPSGLVTQQAGCLAVTLGFPITIIQGIPSLSLLRWIPCALDTILASPLVCSFVLLELTAASEIRHWRENLRFCFLAGDILCSFFFPLHCPYKALSQACLSEGQQCGVLCTEKA